MATRRRSRVFEALNDPTLTPATQPPRPTEQIKQAQARAAAKKQAARKSRPAKKRRQPLQPEKVTVPQRDYEGRTAVCFASGPSLTTEVVKLIEPYHQAGRVACFGLNDTYRIVPYLDEFYACDNHWWKYHIEHPQDGVNVLDQKGRIWGNQTACRTLNAHIDKVCILKGHGGRGFSEKPELIHWGSNSGFQLLNLAYHFGVSRMLLVGYNMQVPNKMGTKGHHFFGPHPKPMSQSGSYKGFAKQFTTISGVTRKMIINCTPDSALDCFEKDDLKTQLDLS